ncbi:hypothetical protein [Methylobacterium sp. J-092]|uniref:hypothetical protein n=1 Tax=Methylobacterium sp. J-092 TaxID=2836667 RepID=UPI001FB91310|nr:hypothetical protein [Methylobacterium sp. J-092]MCJ2009768.1 hypothetical protein [Methylobacterium sp. J-092]
MAPRTKPAAPVVTADFGMRDADGKPWLAFSADGAEFASGVYPGTLPQARELAQSINGRLSAVAAMKAVLSDVRDPDTDTAIAPATAEALIDALMAMGERA